MAMMLVTGAARGIGAAIAVEAARKGFDVAIHFGHSRERAELVAETVRAAGRKAVTVKADLGDPTSVSALFQEVDARLGKLDVLVNNAATDHLGEFAQIALPDINRVLTVNLVSLMRCCQEAILRMARKHGGKGGAIINISSISPRTGGIPGDVIYTATKGAVDALTLSLSNEIAREGVRVCAVRPGLTHTEMLEAAIGADGLREKARQAVPMGRPARPEEIAKLVVWLATDEASYVTGHALDVAGGR
jgi:NAD(P)-dependent dehydrogenase (short-subunit alcohol dehydrogenase family)